MVKSPRVVWNRIMKASLLAAVGGILRPLPFGYPQVARQIAVRAYAAEAARDKLMGHGAALRRPMLEGQPAAGVQMSRGRLDDEAQVRQCVFTRCQRLPRFILQGQQCRI